MRCNYCGTEIKSGMKYCPVCGKEQGVKKGSAEHGTGTIFGGDGIPGTITEDPQKPEKYKKEKKKRKKGKKIKNILILIIILLLTIVIAGIVFFVKSPARNIIKQMNKGNYQIAVQIYHQKVKDDFIQELLLKRLSSADCQSVLKEFKEGKISHEEASEIVRSYQNLEVKGMDEFFAEEIITLDSLYDSMEAYDKAEKLYKAGNYAEAMEAYALVDENDDNYQDAQTKLSKCVENYKKDILEKTGQTESVEDYEDAIALINIAAQVVKDDEEILNRLAELEDGYAALLKSEALSNGTQYIKAGKYEEIFELLKKALETNSGDNELENLQKTAEDEYVKTVQSAVDAYLAEENYEEAIKYLKEANKILESNTDISDLLTEVQENVPVQLCDVKISESRDYKAGQDLTVMEDSIGNVYSPGNLYKMSPYYDDPAYATYYLNGEYSRIKGVIAVADDSETSKLGKVSILDENGKILYTSGDMSRTTAPKTIDVDVSGAEWITISAENSDGYHFKVFVANWVLYKD